jgi:hypothetical protein
MRGIPQCGASTFYRLFAGVTLPNGALELLCPIGQINYGSYRSAPGDTNPSLPNPIPPVPGIANYPLVATTTTNLGVTSANLGDYFVGDFEFFWSNGCTGISSTWATTVGSVDPDFVNSLNAFLVNTPPFPGLSVPLSEYAS